MNRKTIIDKTVYGGTLVDKYFFIFDDGTDMQVSFYEWDQFEVGDEYIIEDVPDSFVEAMKDIVKGKTVPLDKALNEKPSIDWKEAHDMQQKLVISYVLENEKLKTANYELDRANKAMKETLINICDCFEMRDDLYTKDWHAIQAFANKARICLENIGYEWKKDK